MGQELRRKTIFVVGAGASRDFGFPVGPELVDQIRTKLDSEFHETSPVLPVGPVRRALENAGTVSDYKDAVRQLRAGLGPGDSIDTFLFRRKGDQKVRDIGMMTLAEVILDAERKSQLKSFHADEFEQSINAQRLTSNSWPAVMLDILLRNHSPQDVSENLFADIGFVIFNYDRCVEQSLFHHLRLRQHLSATRAKEIVTSVPMVHVYGVLGDPWDGALPFGASDARLSEIASNLRTYHEELDSVAREQQIRELMDHAEKVVFLGFGFHPNNTRLLFPNDNFHNAQLWGSAYGLNGSQLFEKVDAQTGSLFIAGNCTEFFRKVDSDVFSAPWTVKPGEF